MLTKASLKLFQYIQNFSFYILGSPAYFDSNKKLIFLTNSRIRWFLCVVNCSLIVILTLIILERYIWLVTKKYDDRVMMILCMIGSVGFSMETVSSIIYLIQAKECAHFTNMFLKYFQKFKRKRFIRHFEPSYKEIFKRVNYFFVGLYISKKIVTSKILKSSMNVENILKVTFILLLTQPICVFIICLVLFLQPNRQIYITSIVPWIEPSATLIVCITMLTLPIITVGLSVLASTFGFALLFYHELNFILQEIK